MAIDPYFTRIHRWIAIDEVVVLELNPNNGKIEDDKTETFPKNNDRMEIVFVDTWMVWRIFRPNGKIRDAGMFPPWRVVQVTSDP